MRTVFWGTSPVAAIVLEALIGSGTQIVTVFTKPDREAGRGRHSCASPVKTVAQAHALPVIQPETWDANACSMLAQLKAELGIVVAYGLLLPEAVLDTLRLGCVNLHTSLLPRWRGAAPLSRAIEAGDTSTGVCLMKLVPELDAGPIVYRKDCLIEADDTTATLGQKLATLGAEILCSFLHRPSQECEHLLTTATPQELTGVCYAPKLSKAEAEIDWRQPAMAIERKVRALNPWPIAQTHLRHSVVRIWESRLSETPPASASPGHITVTGQRLLVHCGQGELLEVTKLQLPGKKVLPVRDFLNGHRVNAASFTRQQTKEPAR